MKTGPEKQTTRLPGRDAIEYAGWKIQTGFLEGNLLGCDTDGIDEVASVRAYAKALENAIESEFPGAFVKIRVDAASGCEPANMHLAHSPDRDYEAEEEVEEAVGAIGEEIYQDFHWIVFSQGSEVAQ